MNHYEGNSLVAGLPNNGYSRTQSLSNGAGQAALAALRIHQQSQPQQPPQSPPRAPQRRTSSMTSNIRRSNSLQSYTYHPKGSYVPGGKANINDKPAVPRHSSLTNRNSLQAPKRLNSLNSQNSSRREYAPQYPQYDEAEELDEEETIITTKTTKVVDSLGRTQSITTKTIRTLPDGSNIIETTTKNISRSNSRTNSLTSGRAGSMVSNGNPNINLTRIEEDLQDFDYNYELDNEHVRDVNHNNLKLNVHEEGNALGSPIKELRVLRPVERTSSITSLEQNNPISVETSPQKPLRSILKNTQRPAFDEGDELVEPDHAEKQHPYKNLSANPDRPPSVKPPTIPLNETSSSKVKNSLKNQLVPNLASPRAIHDDVSSSISGASQSSIKFDDRVETFPIYSREKKTSFHIQPAPTSPKTVAAKDPKTDPDFYAAAMAAAYKKVYGDRNPQEASTPAQASPKAADFVPSSPEEPMSADMNGLVEHKIKREKKAEQPQGIETDFKYENHHRDFVKHSLRDQVPKSSTRKDRSKQESKAIKEAEKQAKLEAKLEEKRLQEEAKKAQTEEKIARKEEKKSGRKKFGFFGKRRNSTDTHGYDTTESVISDLENRSQLGSPAHNTAKPIDRIDEDAIHPQKFVQPAVLNDSQEAATKNVLSNDGIIREVVGEPVNTDVTPPVGRTTAPDSITESVDRSATTTSTPYVSASPSNITPVSNNQVSPTIPVPQLSEIEEPNITDYESLTEDGDLEDGQFEESDVGKREPDHAVQPLEPEYVPTVEPDVLEPEPSETSAANILGKTVIVEHIPEINQQNIHESEAYIEQESPVEVPSISAETPPQAIVQEEIASPEIISAIQLVPQGESVVSANKGPIIENESIEIPSLESNNLKTNVSDEVVSSQEHGGLSIGERKSTIDTPLSNSEQSSPIGEEAPHTHDANHNFDGNIAVNKKGDKKKSSKFRQKVLRYFINGYDRYDK